MRSGCSESVDGLVVFVSSIEIYQNDRNTLCFGGTNFASPVLEVLLQIQVLPVTSLGW